MNTHTTAQDIIRNAQAVRERLMGRGKVVNVLQDVLEAKARREAEEAKDKRDASIARKIQVQERRKGLWLTEKQHEIAVELYEKGKTYLEIGEAVGKEIEAVAYHIQRHREHFKGRERTKPIVPSEIKLPERIAIIVYQVLERHRGVKILDIYDSNKARHIAAARREVFYVLRNSGVSSSNIARYFRRDARGVRRSIMHFGAL